MIEYFANIYRNSKALVQGHWITLRYMFKPAVTLHYLDEKLVPSRSSAAPCCSTRTPASPATCA